MFLRKIRHLMIFGINPCSSGCDQMEQHQDVAVRGGVKLTREYVQYLKDEIGRLRHENEVKNAYLKKLREKR